MMTFQVCFGKSSVNSSPMGPVKGLEVCHSRSLVRAHWKEQRLFLPDIKGRRSLSDGGFALNRGVSMVQKTPSSSANW